MFLCRFTIRGLTSRRSQRRLEPIVLREGFRRTESQVRRGSAFFVRPHYTFMKIKRLFRLQIGMVLVLLVYLLFAGYLIVTLPSHAMPMRFSSTIAEQQIRTDTLPQLQSDFRSAILHLAELHRDN